MTTSAWGRPSLRSLFDAIREVETGSHEDPARAVGDGGRSIGPYQIQERYWRDSGVAGRYGDVRKSAYAQRTMVAYWTRYCPDALARGDWQTLARVHNGGPEGGRDASTLKYWRKVDEVMRRTGR
jgi:hypothetical protein